MIILPTEKRFDWKHSPVVIFILVLLNILVYFGYQFGDDEKAYKAIVEYKQQNFLEKEWPVYTEYLKQNGELERLENEQSYYDNKDDPTNDFYLLYSIVSDTDFYQYLDENAFNLFYLSYVESWALPRQQINSVMRSVSTNAYGLIPNKMSPVTVITHQFLHGSVMHLLGNLFFLIICGFAVEAAIGHFKFLLFYLISGISGGLLFSWMDFSSTAPLIGASGAISGVMAMYLWVFRFKKIEFFYWFFVFVGYFRAPALFILPFYIGKELYDFFNTSGSNVAFMAHAGGFIAGSVLMAVAYFINPKMMNQAYIEEDQETPQIQRDLAVVYDYISKMKLNSALSALDKFIEKNGVNFEHLLLRYNLLKMQKNRRYVDDMGMLLSMKNLNENELIKVQNLWNKNPDDQNSLDETQLYTFAWNMANNIQFNTAEEIFDVLNNKQKKHAMLGNLARKLSVIFDKKHDKNKKDKYTNIAQELR